MNEEEMEVTQACAVCSTDTSVDDLLTTAWDTLVCNDCVQVCDRCDSIETVNDSFYCVDGDYTWCESCTSNRAYYCDSCEERNSNGTAYIQDRGESWCDYCTDNAYWCDNCDNWYADGCEDCNEDTDDEGNRVIHDYSYRPDAIFHTTNPDERLFFGLEIEVEARDNRAESSRYAYQLEGMEYAYLKNDGSLDNGFEIVTHPMSHDYYKNEAQDFWNVIQTLRTEYKVKSWDTRTCGVHIHISRTGFNGGAHMHRFLNLVYSNQALYSRLAGRESDQWAKFTDVQGIEYQRDENGNIKRDENGWFIPGKSIRSFKDKLSNDSRTDRYSAVNTNNRATLEMRIFRGTVNPDTLKAHIDLAHASVEYTRTMSVIEVRSGSLNADRFISYIVDNAELYPELNARLAKLNLISVGLARQTESV